MAGLGPVDDEHEVTLFESARVVPFMTSPVRSGAVEVRVMATGAIPRGMGDAPSPPSG